MNKKITVFTPTYNRANTIERCYESLKRQTNSNFIWLIVDDGSTDNTSELIEKFIAEKQIEIVYIKQENKGMHGAHNTAHQNINTELCICCDSDDYLSDNAIELILNRWQAISDKDSYSGLIGLDSSLDGKVLANFPENLKKTKLYDLRYKYKGGGDYKLVFKTDLIKKKPYPEIQGEKYLAVGYKYFNLDVKYNLAIINEILCYVEYLNDGGTFNKIKHYVESPKGFSHYRREMMKCSPDKAVKFRQAVHYVSSSIFENNKKFIQDSPEKFITFCAIPFGVTLNMFIRFKYKKFK